MSTRTFFIFKFMHATPPHYTQRRKRPSLKNCHTKTRMIKSLVVVLRTPISTICRREYIGKYILIMFLAFVAEKMI